MLEVLICGTLAIGQRKSILFWRRWCARLWLWTYLRFNVVPIFLHVEKYSFASWHSNIKFLFPACICSISCSGLLRNKPLQNSLSFYQSYDPTSEHRPHGAWDRCQATLFISMLGHKLGPQIPRAWLGWLYMTKLICTVCMCEKSSHSKNIRRAIICRGAAKNRRAAPFLLCKSIDWKY